jgi:hypothetical protein
MLIMSSVICGLLLHGLGLQHPRLSHSPYSRRHGRLPPRTRPLALSEAASTLGKWLEEVYDQVDYEAVLLAADAADDDIDDSSDEFIYGETSLDFFLPVLRRALGASSNQPVQGSFVDLGGGKGQLALAAARAEPDSLSPCVSLELLPELHRIAAAAIAVVTTTDKELGTRVVAQQGSVYDLGSLELSQIGAAAVVFAYASKFASLDGEHVEQLSTTLAASGLPRSAVVITVNRKLCEHDWEQAAPPLEGPTPQETAGVGTAFFWRRRG